MEMENVGMKNIEKPPNTYKNMGRKPPT